MALTAAIPVVTEAANTAVGLSAEEATSVCAGTSGSQFFLHDDRASLILGFSAFDLAKEDSGSDIATTLNQQCVNGKSYFLYHLRPPEARILILLSAYIH